MRAFFDIFLVLMVITISAVSSAMLSRQRARVTWWDYIYPFLGVALWFVLKEYGAGERVSGSNFLVEIFIISMASATIPWIRFAMTFIKAGFFTYISLIMTLVPAALSLLLRFIMPELPE